MLHENSIEESDALAFIDTGAIEQSDEALEVSCDSAHLTAEGSSHDFPDNLVVDSLGDVNTLGLHPQNFLTTSGLVFGMSDASLDFLDAGYRVPTTTVNSLVMHPRNTSTALGPLPDIGVRPKETFDIPDGSGSAYLGNMASTTIFDPIDTYLSGDLNGLGQ
ncbi:hypothetical protein ACHAQA_007881, partial [Verticillium albo-atrum]